MAHSFETFLFNTAQLSGSKILLKRTVTVNYVCARKSHSNNFVSNQDVGPLVVSGVL